MIAAIKAWIQSKLAILEWSFLAIILIATFYLGYHVRIILDEAATSKQTVRVVNAIPQIITKTNTITKVIHDSNDPCSNTAIPDSILEQLRQQ